MKTVNPVELPILILNGTITSKGWFLNELMSMHGNYGLKITYIEMEHFNMGLNEIIYDSRYFTHTVPNTKGELTIIHPREDHPLQEEVDKLYNINFNLRGKLISVSKNTEKSDKAHRLSVLLHKMGNTPIHVRQSTDELRYLSEYFEVVDGVIEPKPEYAKYL